MPPLDLPLMTADTKLEFADAASCAAWLQTVPLSSVAAAHGRLLNQIGKLDDFELPAPERLRVLELLSEPVAFVQAEHAKKFAGKPVPLAQQEEEAFGQVHALWNALARGYERCLEAAAGEARLAEQIALLCQRALWCSGERLAGHHKAFREISAEDWQALHRLFAAAEVHGVLDQAVSASADRARTTCLQTYAHALLLQLANDPSEQSPKQLAISSRWLDRWLSTVRIGRESFASELEVAPLMVDLAAANGATHQALSGESVRHFGLDELAASLRSHAARLRLGETPQALGLGEDISAVAAELHLRTLHRRCCEPPKARASSRHATNAAAELCTGLPAVHYFMTGKPFRQPGEDRALSKAQREEIATFGRVATRQEEVHGALQGFELENWIVRDESLEGLRIERSEDGGKGRLVLQQLVAVRPSDAKCFMLGVVRWLSASKKSGLQAGVRVLPGVPQAVSVRATGVNATREKYLQAVLLPALPALHSSATLVLPAGWYRPRRVIEVSSDKIEQILLTGIVERGADFERVSFGAP